MDTFIFKVVFAALLTAFACSSSFASGPENVLVVVNAESGDSLAVANHFIQLRDIPS